MPLVHGARPGPGVGDVRVVQLEGGDLSLDRALELFEEGIQVSRFCSSKLEQAERKVEILTKAADGDLKEEPFTGEQKEN